MGGIGADLRYSVRTLLRQPAFLLAAVATLAVGIGATTAVFSVSYGLLFRPLPYPEPDRLVMIWSRNPERGWNRTDMSIPDALDVRARATSLDGMAVMQRASVNLTGTEQPERVEARRVTADLLSILGGRPALGRDLTEADTRPGAAGVALLSNGFWQRRFGSDAGVVGRTIQLDGEPYIVAGVLPADFVLPDEAPEVLLNLREDVSTANRASHSQVVLARLRPGVAIDRANAELATVSTALAAEHPATNAGWDMYAVPIRDDNLGDVGATAARVLMGAVGFVLLMACVNVANLLLARSAARRREMTVRGALGASRGRLLRQLLTESFVLALIGCLAGTLLAYWIVRLIVAGLPGNMPPIFRFEMDMPVLVFAVAISVAATLVFGLVPALRAARGGALELREEGRAGTGRRGRRFGNGLVVTQMALAVVLLVGGGTLMRSVSHMQNRNLGYEQGNVLTFRLSPPAATYADAAALQTIHDAVHERIVAVPGVQAAGTIQSLPLRGSNNVNTYDLPGLSGAEEGWPGRMGWLSPGYLDAVSARVIAGRGILETDRMGTPPIALVNQTLARRHFTTNEDAVGATIRVDDRTYTIVGVVADMVERAFNRDPEPSIYHASAQHGLRARSFAVRLTGEPAAVLPRIREAVRAVDPDLPLFEVQPLSDLIAMRLNPYTVIAGLMLCFAAVSLLLGAVGIYGVTAYGVGRRTHEIGLRMAVGAERSGVVRMIVVEGMKWAVLGIVIGTALAFPLSRALRALAVGVNPSDPRTFAAVAITLLAIALLGAWLPARRAARLDPVRALSGD
jgi:putative ABC transport system permease protein